MSNEDYVNELLKHWEQQYRDGVDLTADQLCTDSSQKHLIVPLQHAIDSPIAFASAIDCQVQNVVSVWSWICV